MHWHILNYIGLLKLTVKQYLLTRVSYLFARASRPYDLSAMPDCVTNYAL